MTDPAQRRRDALVLGAEAEQQVALALQSQGWRICARNWRGGGGELDIVAERDGHVQFVEVKARQPGDWGGLEVVDRAKQRKLSRAADAWLDRWTGQLEAASFTVVMVEGTDMHWVPDAFDEVG